MPNKIVVLTDLSAVLAGPLTNEQLISLLIFGSTNNLKLYDPTKSYKKGDKVYYYDGTVFKVYSATKDGATGTFDLNYWKEFSLLGGNIGGGSAMGDVTLTTALDNNLIDSVMRL